MLKIIALLMAVLLPASDCLAYNLRGQARAALEDQTPKGVPLRFTPQKMKWEYNKIRIWGSVTNTGERRQEFVAVSFTALDKERGFLGRHKWFIDPTDLNAGESGNLDGVFIDTEGRLPAIIQVTVSGDEP